MIMRETFIKDLDITGVSSVGKDFIKSSIILRINKSTVLIICMNAIFVTKNLSDLSVKVHMKCHVDKRNFMCEICGKVFKTLSILQAHSNVHTKETKYSCAVCDKTYSYRASLYLHMRSHSGHRPYLCKFCSATFMVKSHLADHLKTHTNERPFKCMYCQASFARAVILKKHLKSHLRAGIEVNLEKALLHAKLKIKESKISVDVAKQSQTSTNAAHCSSNDPIITSHESNLFETSKENVVLHSKVLFDEDEHVTVILSANENGEGNAKTSLLVCDKDESQKVIVIGVDSCSANSVLKDDPELYISDVIRSKSSICHIKLMTVFETFDGPHISVEASMSESEESDLSRGRDSSVCHLFSHKTKKRLDLSSNAVPGSGFKSGILINSKQKFNEINRNTSNLNADTVSHSCITAGKISNILNESDVHEYSVGISDFDDCKRKKSKKCQYCNSKYKYSACLRAHEEKHSKELLLHYSHQEQNGTVCTNKLTAVGEGINNSSVSCVQENLPFRCEFCKADFSCRSELRKHAKLHSAKYKYLCMKCNQAFNQEIFLTRHNCSSQGSKPILGRKTPNIAMKSHINIPTISIGSPQKYSRNTEPKPFYPNCQDPKDVALSHSSSHYQKIENGSEEMSAVKGSINESEDEEKFAQEDVSRSISKKDPNSCDNDVSSLRSFGDGVKNTFALSDESLLPHIDTYEIEVTVSTDCQDYKKTEGSKDNSKKYSKCSQLLRCKYCPMQFRFISILKIHERSHTGEKPFSCPVCKKTFSKKSNMELHKRIHTGEQSFLCDYCGKYFSYKYSLNAHKRLHTNELPFICIICGKGFRYESSRSVHFKRHMGNKAFKCDYCSKAFVSKVEMEDHRRTHTGEKPYSCEHCNQSFSHRHHLADHSRIHTGLKPYKCQVCNKSFRRLGMLKCHNRQHDDCVDE